MTVRSTAAVDWSDVALLFHVLVDAAHDRLRITTPYFVPDDDSIERLARAVQRGVRVEVLTAGRHNDSRLSQYAGRRWYQRLLDAGVSLRHYERTMMHAKVLTVDGWLACLGSPNFNHRSMHRDDELCLVVDDEAVVTRLDEHFDEDAEAGQPIDPERWKRRSWLSRGLEALAGLVRTEV